MRGCAGTLKCASEKLGCWRLRPWLPLPPSRLREMGLFGGRSKSPKKNLSISEEQSLLQAPPHLPAPGVRPSSPDPVPVPVSVASAPAAIPAPAPGAGGAVNSQSSTPTSSNRSWIKGKISPKDKERKKSPPRDHDGEAANGADAPPVSSAPEQPAAAETNVSALAPPAAPPPPPPPPPPQPAAASASASSHANGASVRKKNDARKEERGLGYGMGFKQIEQWAMPDWSGAYSDRSAGTKGRPERNKDGTRNWNKGHSTVKNGHGNRTSAGAAAAGDLGLGAPDRGAGTFFNAHSLRHAYIAVPNFELHNEPLPAAPREERPDFSGVWRLSDTDGAWDEYLKRCKVDATRRALARGTFYGRNRSLQTIEMPSCDELSITNVVDKPFRATVTFVQEGEKVGEPKKEGEAKEEAKSKEGDENAKAANGSADANGEAKAGADEGAAKNGDEPVLAEARVQGAALMLRIDGSEQPVGAYTGVRSPADPRARVPRTACIPTPRPSAPRPLKPVPVPVCVQSGLDIKGTVQWEGRAMMVRYTIPGGANAIIKRTLSDDLTMVVRVMCADFDAVATYQKVDKDHDIIPKAFKLPTDSPGLKA